MKQHSLIFISLLVLTGCSQDNSPPDSALHTQVQPNSTDVKGTITPENWPQQAPVMVRDTDTEDRITDLLSRMSIEEKVGQIIQADIASVTPEEVRDYHLGSILNGGGSAPGGDNRTTPDKWLDLADKFWLASTDTSDGGVGIPVLWGTDAVHGHSNILGATIFPHNIGLGAANDPDIMESIGRATALEMRVTGLDWTFAPTIAVVRNDRWGRTYESYSEDPEIVKAYTPRIVEGIQGKLGSKDFLANGHMMATVKHFAGDGGTIDGKDQGNNVSSEAELRDQQAAAYPLAIAAGVQSVMASFNSYHGKKMHGHREMLTDVLVGRMGFDGFVVGDWNGHGQVAECTNTSCPQSINAGLDMYMAPDSWKGLYASTLAQVKAGDISQARLDEAVGRILRVKIRSGLFASGKPSSRPYAGDYDLLGAPKHRDIARDAVRKSLVMLKNEGGILPIQLGTTVLMAGDGAHNIGKQSGGWTLNWQGTDNKREHFPNGQSIYEGFVEALGADKVILSPNGEYQTKPDLAIIVFGEDPYAEFQGDRPNVDYPSDDGLRLLQKFQQEDVPTVTIFISGRPLYVNPELNASTAFVAAWLPGTEGGGIADVLVADSQGSPRFDAHGRLSFSWPRKATQVEVNLGDKPYNPLFPYGFGLSYGDDGSLAELPEDSGLGKSSIAAKGDLLAYGDPLGDWSLILRDAEGDTRIGDSRGSSAGALVSAEPADNEVQEDTIVVTWSGAGSVMIEGRPVDFMRETNGDMVLELHYRVLQAPAKQVSVQMGEDNVPHTSIDITESLASQAGGGWQKGRLPLSCFASSIRNPNGTDMSAITVPLMIQSGGALSLQLASASISANTGKTGCEL